jgi:transposase InsO family protein
MKQRKAQRQEKVLQYFHAAFHHSAGYRKVQRDVLEDGIPCCEETIRRDYQELNIAANTKKKFKVQTTDSNHNSPIAPNLLDRDFTAEKPGEKMVTDITYVLTRQGFLYVTLVIDLFSRRVTGWSIEEAMTVDSVLKALKMALQKLLFFPSVMLLHSDRGSQYAASLFRQACCLASIVQSMSRKGNCWDNAVAESVNGKFKTDALPSRGL